MGIPGRDQPGATRSAADSHFAEPARLCLQVIGVDGLSAGVASIIVDLDCQHRNGLGFAGKKGTLQIR